MADSPAGADTIRVLVATDNHVGYNERDSIRGDDSAKTFDEILRLAKQKTVDMVLLAGDLFHENRPSRKSLNAVIRSLRMNCLGDKPCELEMLSDPTEHFDATFDHVNYEDQDINISIPVFTIHGNHDDPSGEGHLSALDVLQTCGLANYYGRTPESDNVLVKPVLLQKGRTKLALYGMSNVRDERLYRTFRDSRVKFFRPSAQKENWFNLLSVHQNHHAYTETGYLPENFLPDFANLVIWGHEHECIINPRFNPEMSFDVMQPGSSVATSLMPGEAVDKHVAILEITGQTYKHEAIRLKTVRPFVMREIVLQEERGMKALAKKDNNRSEITRHLMGVIEELIEEAKKKWAELREQVDEEGGEEEGEMPLPLVRLRVEYSAPEGGKFECENPQRFSSRFSSRVANTNDVIQFYKKKAAASRKSKDDVQAPDESTLAQLTMDTIKVDKLVRECLSGQTLNVIPHNQLGDAVRDFVDKGDKHAIELCVDDNGNKAVEHLLERDNPEDGLIDEMNKYRLKVEQMWAANHGKRLHSTKLKPKPDHWDSEVDGEWADQPAAHPLEISDDEQNDKDSDEQSVVRSSAAQKPSQSAAKGQIQRGNSTRKPARGSSAANTKSGGSHRTVSGAIGNEDVIMLEDDEYESEGNTAQSGNRATSNTNGRRVNSSTVAKNTGRSTRPATRQTRLNFSQQQRQQKSAQQELSDDEISDDDDAFEPNLVAKRGKAQR